MSDKFGEKRIEHGMIQEKTSKDITDNRKYNYINKDIVIEVSQVLLKVRTALTLLECPEDTWG